jgi:hypothetical protein
MVNYRGSTGYGQQFPTRSSEIKMATKPRCLYGGVRLAPLSVAGHDRIGVEGVVRGPTERLAHHSDPHLQGGYPDRRNRNLVSYNYMTYYNQYEQMNLASSSPR